MRSISIVLATLMTLLSATAAFADCVYDGQTYPEGTRVGAFVCEGGAWVER